MYKINNKFHFYCVRNIEPIIQSPFQSKNIITTPNDSKKNEKNERNCIQIYILLLKMYIYCYDSHAHA